MLPQTLVSGIKALRPFVPSKDFAESTRFYETLGFTAMPLGPELAEMRLGDFTFLLQDFYVADYAGNFMMHMMVDDADAWWRHIEPLALEKTFNVSPPKAPALQSWGLKVLFLYDPASVLWHIASRP